MTAVILTGAAGQGKTGEAIQELRRLLELKLFGKIWVLLPTELQIGAFRARLVQELGQPAHFGVEFFDFYDLYSRILELAGTPQRRVKEAARFRILRYVLAELLHEEKLTHFKAIAEMPGFVSLVSNFIQELKQAEITPEEFEVIATTSKDRDIVAIYAAYQEFLRGRDLVDSDGEGWLARASVERAERIDVDLLIVDGYDQFNPVQARLLALLAARLPDTLLTLTYQPDRATTAHRRFAQTRGRLLAWEVWQERALRAGHHQTRPASLEHLTAQLFDLHGQTIMPDDALALIETPDRLREVQTVLRQVKRLLLEGTPPEQIAIVARNVEPYTPYFLETAPAYGVPLATRRGAPLLENPAVAAFWGLVDLASEDFPRRAVMDSLYSTYLRCPDLTSWQINRLDLISRTRIVVKGRATWLEAIALAASGQTGEDGERAPDALSEAQSQKMRAGLGRFFARITPPRQATARQFVTWLEALIGPDPLPLTEEERPPLFGDHFSLVAQIRAAGAEPGLVARDLAAIDHLKRVFIEVRAAYELVDAYEAIPWETFRLDLQIAMENATVPTARPGNRLGRVLLASIYEARGLAHDHIFVLGLSEGEFPARTPENVLYTDEERRQMQSYNLPLLTTAEAADESSLFYEITALARQRLTLTRPYIDDRGNEWPASPYWRAVLQLVPAPVERLRIDSPIGLDNAARRSEALVALAQVLDRKLDDQASAIHNWILEQSRLVDCWSNALLGRKIERSRASRLTPHDQYTGRLSDSILRDKAAELLGPDHVWSASQFDEYGTCPYRFFARRLLQLQALQEPEEGMNQLQIGTLYHEILEHTYRKIAYDGLAIRPENTEIALQVLDEKLDQFLSEAPERHGFRATALWPHEQLTIRRKLQSLVEKDFNGEIDFQKYFGEGGRYNLRQEVRFGFEGEKAVLLEGDAGPLQVAGAIDRVDMIAGHLVVIDYKSGIRTFNSVDMVEGRNVQMMLYMHAAHQLLPDNPIEGGTFWSIGSMKLSGTILAADPQIEEARMALHQRILEGRQGIFVNRPSKRTAEGHCNRYCEYRQLCRVERHAGNKPDQSIDAVHP